MTTPVDWGPPLWKLLHGVAERLDRQTVPLLITDERNAWIQFLKSIDATLPCAKCSAHYKSWRTRNSPDRLGAGIRLASRKWLWDLHNEINQEKGVESPPLDTMETLYGPLRTYELKDALDKCVESFQKGAILRLVASPAIHDFKRRAQLILRLTS